jgi:hypothetical protein
MTFEIKNGGSAPTSFRGDLMMTYEAMEIGKFFDIPVGTKTAEQIKMQVFEAVHAYRKTCPGFKVKPVDEGTFVRVWRVADKVVKSV